MHAVVIERNFAAMQFRLREGVVHILHQLRRVQLLNSEICILDLRAKEPHRGSIGGVDDAAIGQQQEGFAQGIKQRIEGITFAVAFAQKEIDRHHRRNQHPQDNRTRRRPTHTAHRAAQDRHRHRHTHNPTLCRSNRIVERTPLHCLRITHDAAFGPHLLTHLWTIGMILQCRRIRIRIRHHPTILRDDGNAEGFFTIDINRMRNRRHIIALQIRCDGT